MKSNENEYKVYPLTLERWQDFETLFGEKGAFAGCWCLFWRVKRSDFMKMSGDERKTMMHDMVDDGSVPGVLLYEGEQPIGWCAIAPRDDLYPLLHSRTIKPVDDQPAWAIVCFFVNRTYRRNGLMKWLIQGALDYAKEQGAKIVEAYPTDTQAEKINGKKLTGYNGYMGIASAFLYLGFVEVGRANETQPIMRYFLR